MQQLINLSDEADQVVTYVLPDGSLLTLEFIYRPGIQRWSFNLSHPSLTLNGVNLTLGPNLLRQWRNVCAFGMAVTSTDQGDPALIDDFTSGRIGIFMLSSDEVAEVETTYYAPTPLVNP